MCVAIYIPSGETVAEHILRGVFRRNDDGVGISWSDGGALHIWKTMADIDAIVAMVQNMIALPRLVHFRYATHGSKTLDNIHPFWLDERRRAVVVHNGVIQIGRANDESDTRAFVRNVLGQMRDGWWNNPTTVSQIERLVSGSRIVIMEEDGRPHYLNKSSGETSAEGVWFSNAQWRDFVDPSCKHFAASAILAATGERKVWHTQQRDAFDSNTQRDPFQSTTSQAPKTSSSVAPGAANAAPRGTGTMPLPDGPTKQQTSPSGSSSSTGGSTLNSAPQSVSGGEIITAGPVTDSDIQQWRSSLGFAFLRDTYVAGYAFMPDGPYGEIKASCSDCTDTTTAAQAMDDMVHAPITVFDLLGDDLAYATCVGCMSHLFNIVRKDMELIVEEENASVSWLDSDDRDLPPAHMTVSEMAQADGSPSPEEPTTALVSGTHVSPYTD